MTRKIDAVLVVMAAVASVQGYAADIVGQPFDVWSDAADNFVRDAVYNPEADEYRVQARGSPRAAALGEIIMMRRCMPGIKRRAESETVRARIVAA